MKKEVEVVDPVVQRTWREVSESGAGQLAASYVLTTAIVGLTRAGVADRLSSSWTPLQALVPPGGRADRVGQVLRYLEIREVVESGADGWRLTARGERLFGEVAESLLGYYVDAYGPVLHRIGDLLDGSARYDVDVRRDTEQLGLRCEVLFRSFGADLVRNLAAEYGSRGVLDLGCGTGGLLLDLVTADPDLTGVGLDIAADAIALAATRAEAAGVTDRLRFVQGDAFAPHTWPAEVDRCDLYVAVGALHEHFRDGDQAVVDLLSTYADRLREGRKLLLCEPELHVDAADADFYLVHVLTEQGFPQPRARWQEVIAAAGLTCERIFSAPNTGFRFAYYEITG
ncbi:MAG: methyltransferase domain-containing protein [Saccharothrix sp.]|nr:methyltransferase domain-containing protein [Saccharothrix sp.]